MVTIYFDWNSRNENKKKTKITEEGKQHTKCVLLRQASLAKQKDNEVVDSLDNLTYNQQYYFYNMDKFQTYNGTYYERNKERIKAYYTQNKEKVREYQKQYRTQNKEYFVKYKQTCRQRINQYYKQYYLEHKYEMKQKYLESKNRSKVSKEISTN